MIPPLRGALAGPLWLPSKAPSSLLDGLVSYWPLDETSGVRYDAVGGNHLADVNTVGCAPSSGLWTRTRGVALGTGGALTKTGTLSEWTAGALSILGIASGDGYMEFTAGSLSGLQMLGLSHDHDTSSPYNFAVFDYLLYPHINGYVYAYFNGGGTGRLTPWATGDVFRVGIESGVVKARKNGNLFYTYADAPTYPQYAVASLYTPGVNVSAAMISGADLVDVNPTAKHGSAGSFIRGFSEYLSRSGITGGPDGDFTAAAWVRTINVSGSGTWGILNLGTNGSSSMNNQAGSLYVSNATDLVALVGDGASYVIAIKAGTSINDGNWHLVTMSYDSATRVASVAIDGGAPAASSALAGVKKVPVGVYVGKGATSYSSGSTWQGLMDEVALASRVWTDAERAEAWNGGAGKFLNAAGNDFE